ASLLQSLDIPVVFDNPNVGLQLADQPRVLLIFSSDPEDTPILTAQNGLFAQIAWLPDPTGDPTIRELRFATINPVPGITLVAFDLVQPTSRGSVSINSADPLDPPVINQGFLDSSDVDLFVRGFQTYVANINTQVQLINPDYELLYPDPAII